MTEVRPLGNGSLLREYCNLHSLSTLLGFRDFRKDDCFERVTGRRIFLQSGEPL